MLDEICSVFAFSEQVFQAAFLQFVYAPARKMRDCKGNIPFAAGFPIGARSIPVGTRFCFAKSSVLYLCFRLTRKRGWRRTLRCGRVWRQTLFRGSRTGGFCDVGYGTNAGFLRNKIRLAGKGSEGIYSPRLAAALRAKTTTAAPARGCPSPRPPASLPCSR